MVFNYFKIYGCLKGEKYEKNNAGYINGDAYFVLLRRRSSGA